MSILVRTSVLFAVWVSYFFLIQVTKSLDPIGAGLLGFLLLVVVCGLWGLVDGLRSRPGKLAVVWLPVSALMGVLVHVFTAATETGQFTMGQINLSVLLSDLASGFLFIAGLVAVPGLVGGAVGAAIRSANAPGQADDTPAA